MQPIREFQDVDADRFRREVFASHEPAVLRGLVRDWPLVREGLRSPAALSAYLARSDTGAPVDAILLAPEQRGRIFYDAELTSFNFARTQLPLSNVIEQVERYSRFDDAPTVAVQSAPLALCAPDVARENTLALLHPSIAPRIWFGNAITTPAHFDESANIACVAAGSRRFTLLPPEQARNLYIGPLDFAPTGTPISLVSFRDPDFERFPRFRAALDAAFVAELAPGDAIFIPPLWWHHEESLARFNVLVNFWWNGAPDAPIDSPSALDCLLHCLLDLSHLDAQQKRGWQALFAHFLFDDDETRMAHLPAQRRALYGRLSPADADKLRAFLRARLGD